jgi:ribosomal-protein-alanine N-acetyltransferase
MAVVARGGIRIADSCKVARGEVTRLSRGSLALPDENRNKWTSGSQPRSYLSAHRRAYNPGMPLVVRSYDPREFSALHKLDQACFPPGIAYSRRMLSYFLKLPSAECLVADEESRIGGFILTEENPPLAHIITLDVAETHRRQGVGSTLLAASERNLGLRGVRTILLETAIDNAAAIAFWQRHGYRIEATLKRYYLGRLDAHEMRKILTPSAANSTLPPGANL